jgi:serine/threonine protein kinase
VTYNAFIQHNGSDILIMELLGGGSLEDKMRREDPNNPLPRAKLYWVQLACALRYLHGKRVLHRDIKPANILFNSADDLKLCDFGISQKAQG